MGGGSPPIPQLIGRSLYARAVFMDTGAFLALASTREGQRHEEAVECLRHVRARRLPVYTSLPTIYETHRRMLYDLGANTATRFLDTVFDGTINVVRTEESDETEARNLIGKYPDLTFTDASNMSVMLRLGVSACFSFDRHYWQVGFIRIPPIHV